MNYTAGNSSFSTTIPNLQIGWDSTSLGALQECPRKYFYSIICGWAPREMSVHLSFGLAYHEALERYYHARAQGKSHVEGLRVAVRYCLAVTWNPELKRPITWDSKEKNRETLLRTVVWYLTQFEEDPLETVILANGKPAVELSFRFPIDLTSPDGNPYMFCGHLDRVVKFNGQYHVNDHKTTKYEIKSADFFDKYSPDNQMSMYSFAGKIVYKIPVQGVLVGAAQVLVTLSRFRRGFANRTDNMLIEWYNDKKFWIQQAAEFAVQNYWPMNDKSCGMYGGCPYRGICGKDPRVRDQWLAAGFKKRVWDPLQIRGDI